MFLSSQQMLESQSTVCELLLLLWVMGVFNKERNVLLLHAREVGK